MKLLAFVLLFAAQASFAQWTKLSSKDSLEKVVNHMNQEWIDGNITTGTTVMSAGVFADKATGIRIGLATEKRLQANVKRSADGAKYKMVNSRTTAKQFEAKDVITLVKAYSDGNDLDPSSSETFKLAMGQVYAILKVLAPDTKDLLTVNSSAVYVEGQEKRNVYLYSFTNTKTNKSVLFFIIEGHM